MVCGGGAVGLEHELDREPIAVLHSWLTTAGFAGSANANLYLGIVLLLVVLLFPGGIAGGVSLVRDSAWFQAHWPKTSLRQIQWPRRGGPT